MLREATRAAGASDGVSWEGAAHARGKGAGSRPRSSTASDAGSRSSRMQADFADPHGWTLDPIYKDLFIQIRDDILQQQGGYSTYDHLCHTYTVVEFGRPRGERFKTLLKQMNLRFREIFVDCGQGEESCFELVLESLGMRAEPELKRTRRSPRRRSPSRAAPRRRSPPSRAAPRRRSPSRAASRATPRSSATAAKPLMTLRMVPPKSGWKEAPVRARGACRKGSKGIVPGTRGTVGGAPRAMLNQGASSSDALIAANMPDFPWAVSKMTSEVRSSSWRGCHAEGPKLFLSAKISPGLRYILGGRGWSTMAQLLTRPRRYSTPRKGSRCLMRPRIAMDDLCGELPTNHWLEYSSALISKQLTDMVHVYFI